MRVRVRVRVRGVKVRIRVKVRVRVRVRITVTVTVTVRITVRVRVRDRISSGLQLGRLRGISLGFASRPPSHGGQIDAVAVLEHGHAGRVDFPHLVRVRARVRVTVTVRALARLLAQEG